MSKTTSSVCQTVSEECSVKFTHKITPTESPISKKKTPPNLIINPGSHRGGASAAIQAVNSSPEFSTFFGTMAFL